jgi:transcriptional regulator with XRE-family HTH domain
MAVGRRLKMLREQRGVSMNKVHLETRMSTSYLAKLEAEEFVPGKKNLDKILEALETLDVPESERQMLIKEHEAAQKQRDMIQELVDTLEGRMADIDDPDERMERLDDLLGELRENVGKVPVLTGSGV